MGNTPTLLNIHLLMGILAILIFRTAYNRREARSVKGESITSNTGNTGLKNFRNVDLLIFNNFYSLGFLFTSTSNCGNRFVNASIQITYSAKFVIKLPVNW